MVFGSVKKFLLRVLGLAEKRIEDVTGPFEKSLADVTAYKANLEAKIKAAEAALKAQVGSVQAEIDKMKADLATAMHFKGNVERMLGLDKPAAVASEPTIAVPPKAAPAAPVASSAGPTVDGHRVMPNGKVV